MSDLPGGISRRQLLQGLAATAALFSSSRTFAKLPNLSFWRNKSSFGHLFLWGVNIDGVMGLGFAQRSPNQVASSVSSVGTDTNWSSVGGNHTAYIKTDGTLWICGVNDYGQLGDGTTVSRSSPIQVPGSWTQVAAGYNRTFGIRTDGTLWAWGRDDNGNLGQGVWDQDRSSPVQIPGSWIQISTYDIHSVGIRTDGTMWAWGWNGYGQLGTGNTTDQNSPVQVPGSWTQVSVGTYTTFGIKTGGTLWAWGDNSSGKLGVGDTTNRSSPTQITGTWAEVFACDHTAFARKTDSTLYGWGYNGNGGLIGIGDQVDRSSPTQVPGSWIQVANFGRWGRGTAGIKSDYSLWAWGFALYDQRIVTSISYPPYSPHHVASPSWTQLSAGEGHIKALKSDGTLWWIGENAAGNMGNGYNLYSPIQLAGSWIMVGSAIGASGQGFAMGIKAPDSLWTWGSDSDARGVLGHGDAASRFSPTQLAGQWSDFAAANSFAFGLRTNGTLWAWGGNMNGALGVGDTSDRWSPVQVLGSWVAIAAGGWDWDGGGYGIKTDFTLWSWGSNYFGRLGLNAAGDRSSPSQIPGSWTQIACGTQHALAITVDGRLFSWGRNGYGQLGVGDTSTRSSPVQIAGSWSMISAGGDMSFGLKLDGTMWAWGRNSDGTLGLGNTTSRSSPTQVPGLWKAVSVENSYGRSALWLRPDGSLWRTGANYGRGATGRYLGWEDYRSSPVQIAGRWKALGKNGFGAIREI